MAPSPLVSATLQSAVLSGTSNVVAQAIKAYRSDSPLVIDWVPVFQFVLFTFVSTPPNFLWQDFLESAFPANPKNPTVAPTNQAVAAAANGDEKELDREAREGLLVEPSPTGKLSKRNTIAKLVLDQTVGAAVNTLLFSTYTHAIQAAMAHRPATAGPGSTSAAFLASGRALDFAQVDWRVVVARSRLDFWPLMGAALGLWPWVSLFNFTLVKSVETRNLVAALAGMVWGVYMSMFAAK